MNRKSLFVVSTVVLLLVFVAGALLYQNEKVQRWNQVVGRNQGAVARDHSPTVGKPSAKVHTVEFLDPACETCSEFYPQVKKIMAVNPDQIRLSIRHVAFHNGSDALEASRRRDKYWQTLEAVLATQGEWVPQRTARTDLVRKAIIEVGIDLERLAKDMNAPEVM